LPPRAIAPLAVDADVSVDDAAADSEAAAAFACAVSLHALCLPTTSADDLREAVSCCLIASPIGIGWPSVSIIISASTLFCWSNNAILPLAKAMSCRSSFHCEVSLDASGLKFPAICPYCCSGVCLVMRHFNPDHLTANRRPTKVMACT